MEMLKSANNGRQCYNIKYSKGLAQRSDKPSERCAFMFAVQNAVTDRVIDINDLHT
jgi:hypothetical protein